MHERSSGTRKKRAEKQAIRPFAGENLRLHVLVSTRHSIAEPKAALRSPRQSFASFPQRPLDGPLELKNHVTIAMPQHFPLSRGSRNDQCESSERPPLEFVPTQTVRGLDFRQWISPFAHNEFPGSHSRAGIPKKNPPWHGPRITRLRIRASAFLPSRQGPVVRCIRMNICRLHTVDE